MAKKISESELQQFRAFDPTLKANVMEAYLIRGMKMNEVAKLFLNSNYSFESIINTFLLAHAIVS
jgi:hypothetical protein